MEVQTFPLFFLPLTYCLYLVRWPQCLDDLANAAPSPSPLSSIAIDSVTDTKPYVPLKHRGCSHCHPTTSASSTLYYWVGSPPHYSYLTNLFPRSQCPSLNKYWLTGMSWIAMLGDWYWFMILQLWWALPICLFCRWRSLNPLTFTTTANVCNVALVLFMWCMITNCHLAWLLYGAPGCHCWLTPLNVSHHCCLPTWWGHSLP